MATDMTLALREFARKKLTEAKQKGATLATATAATISSSVPTSTSFVFRSSATQQQHAAATTSTLRVPLDTKLDALHQANESLHASVTGSSTATLDAAIYKMDLINESLAFTIENIQECSHVMKLLNRQLRESAAMKNEAHKTFYRSTPIIQDGGNAPDEISYEYQY